MSLTLIGLSGSLRHGSYNSGLLRAAGALLAGRAQLQIHPIGNLPHYNQDLEPSELAESLKQAVAAADGLLIATPEYNYGIPGVLKNAIDWLSRPAMGSCLKDKPTGIVGASMSGMGTARAQLQLRQVLYGTLTPVLVHGEVLVGGAKQKFDEQGELTDEPTRAFLERYLAAFVDWVSGLKGARR